MNYNTVINGEQEDMRHVLVLIIGLVLLDKIHTLFYIREFAALSHEGIK